MTDNPRLLIQDVHTDRDRIIDCQLIGMEVLVWEKVPSVPGSLFVAFLSSETTFDIPGRHSQVYWLLPSIQVPSFKQGSA